MTDRPLSVCLVTDQLAAAGPASCLDTGFCELAELLAPHHRVTILHPPPHRLDRVAQTEITDRFARRNIRVQHPDPARYSRDGGTPAAISYGVFQHLLNMQEEFDILHFPDRGGLAFHCLLARDQGLAFEEAIFALHLRGPCRWGLECDGSLFTEAAQLKTDYMERECISRADYLIGPGRHMFSWLAEKRWITPPEDRCLMIPDAFGGPESALAKSVPASLAGPLHLSEIILCGSPDISEGLQVFCDALDLIGERLGQLGTRITFLGDFGMIGPEHAGQVLARRGRSWGFPVRVLPFEQADAGADYLESAAEGLAVIPSFAAHAAPIVRAASLHGRPVLIPRAGETAGLLDDHLQSSMTVDLTPSALADAMLRAVEHGMPQPRLAENADGVARRWLDFHAGVSRPRSHSTPADVPLPRVSLCITHYQRVGKLVDAIASVARQTYPDIELIVVDDGSPDDAVQVALTEIEPIIERLGGRLLRQSNGYLGAARNAAAEVATGDYLCFLDDDDIALPEMVRRLVTAAITTGADIVTGLQIPMDEARRFEAWPDPDRFSGRIDHHPLGGGPLSLAVEENVFGPATALISREAFDRLGGYSTLKGVGHEDFELFLRAVQQGMRVELCPFPAYLYEVGRSSMISTTPVMRNFARVANEIDMTTQPERWRDYLILGSGRQAREVEGERRQRPEAGTAAAGDAPAGPAQDQLRQLADYAKKIGSRVMEAAFLSALRYLDAIAHLGREPTAEERRRALAETGVPPASPDPLSHRMAPETVRQLLEARLSCDDAAIMDRHELALRILRNLDETPPRIGDILIDLRRLARSEPKADDLSHLMDQLLRAMPGQAEELAIRVALVELALRSGDYQLAHKLLRDILRREESGYLDLNPDVAAAVARRQIAGGFQHFLRRGEVEGRQGFDSACEVANLFNSINGSTMRLSEILRWLKAGGG